MEVKELTDKIQEATTVLRENAEKYHKEIEKFGTARSETKEQLDRINADLDAQKAKLDEIGLKVERSKLVLPGEGDKDLEKKARKDAFLKYMRVGRKGMNPEEQKALVEDATGLYLVPEEIEQEVYRSLPQLNFFRSLCPAVQVGRDKLRKRTLTELTMSWGKIEGSASITESTQTPTTGYVYVEDLYGLTKIGEDELMDLDFNLPAIIADSFSIARANTEEAGFVTGRGHTTYEEPEGIAVDTTLQTSIGNGNGAGTKGTYGMNWTTDDMAHTDPGDAWEDVLYAEYLLPTQYLKGSAWLMNRKTEYALRIIRPAVASGYYSNFMWQPSLQAGQPNMIDGFPVYNNNSMKYPADTTAGINIIFGNFGQGYRIVDRMGMSVQRLDELYAESGLVGFKTHFRVGGGIVRHNAFTVICNDV